MYLNQNLLSCKGLKQQVESLQIKTDDLTEKLNLTEEKVLLINIYKK